MSLLNRVKSVFFKDKFIPKINEVVDTSAIIKNRQGLLNSEGKWRTVQFKIDSEWENVRLDRILTQKFDISASLAQKLIRTRKLWIERGAQKIKSFTAGSRLALGDSINLSEIFLPERKERLKPLSAADEEHLKRWTLFEDDAMLILNKPSGMAVHSGPGVKVSLDKLLQRRSEAYRLVHRLDRGTSGVLIVGKGRDNTERLQSLFEAEEAANNGLTKTYLALVAGTPKDRQGRIMTPIYKAKRAFGPEKALETQMTTERSRRADLLDEGKVAITDYRMISAHMTKINGVRVKVSLVEFTPVTGRTHQIRVHAAEQLGCPIVGDHRYGLTTVFNLSKIANVGKGLHLHCKSIKLPDGQTFSAALPRHFIQSLHKFPIHFKQSARR